MDGMTQAMFARRQLEHGDSLSQRTFRVRHTTQLRSFCAGAGAGADIGLPAEAGEVVLFSVPVLADPEAIAADIAAGGILAWDNRPTGDCDLRLSFGARWAEL